MSPIVSALCLGSTAQSGEHKTLQEEKHGRACAPCNSMVHWSMLPLVQQLTCLSRIGAHELSCAGVLTTEWLHHCPPVVLL
jgi:hypothetical protein